MCKLTQHIKSIFLDANSLVSTIHNILIAQRNAEGRRRSKLYQASLGTAESYSRCKVFGRIYSSLKSEDIMSALLQATHCLRSASRLTVPSQVNTEQEAAGHSGRTFRSCDSQYGIDRILKLYSTISLTRLSLFILTSSSSPSRDLQIRQPAWPILKQCSVNKCPHCSKGFESQEHTDLSEQAYAFSFLLLVMAW